MLLVFPVLFVCFFNDTATTEFYTLSLHDALPISFFSDEFPRDPAAKEKFWKDPKVPELLAKLADALANLKEWRSEEHTSELQSHSDLVCRLLLEKKKNKINHIHLPHSRSRHTRDS